MKAAIIAGCVVLSVLSASAAHAEDRVAPDYFDPPECKQFTHEEFRVCINRIWALRPEAPYLPGQWRVEKWDCAFRWEPRYDQRANAYDQTDVPILDLKAIEELRKQFQTKGMKAHCAWLQCLADRGAGKVKHCYINDKRWRQ
jgi:hypothetical protein